MARSSRKGADFEEEDEGDDEEESVEDEEDDDEGVADVEGEDELAVASTVPLKSL